MLSTSRQVGAFFPVGRRKAVPSAPRAPRSEVERCRTWTEVRNPLPDDVDHIGKLTKRAGIFDDRVGGGEPRKAIRLSGDPRLRRLLAHPAFMNEPLEDDGLGGIDDNDDVETVAVLGARLDEQRDVDDDISVLFARPGELGRNDLADGGMNDRLEIAACARISKDDLSERRSVDRTVRADDRRSKPMDDREEHRRARGHHFVRDRVGVDEARPVTDQKLGDGRFA